MIFMRDKLFTVVCNIRTPDGNGNELIGTGSFIVKNNKVYLLTVSHVSKDTNNNSYIVLSDNQSNPIRILLNSLTKNHFWKEHPIADMSLIEIEANKYPKVFQNRCFPFEQVNNSFICASRDDELTSIGFPNGLGIQGKFSPLTFRSYASSAFLTLNRADTDTPSDFFCLENPSVGGYSGGPVFELGYETMGSSMSSKGGTILHGIVHGTMSDNTGGKIAMITPMYYINDLI